MRRARSPQTHARLVIAGLVAAQLAACSTTEPMAPREYRDGHTAAIVTLAGDGTVFAHARTECAVHARDYVTVVPVEVARNGRHALYLYNYLWSTIDQPASAAEDLKLVADGREIPLSPISEPLQPLGLGEVPLERPSRDAVPVVSATTRDLLRLVMHAREVSVVVTRTGRVDRYELWTDRRAALGVFVAPTPAGP